jgi:hypothetical protein
LALAGSENKLSFRDLGPSSGITFRLQNFPTPERNLVETITGGVALLDYDDDGLLDIFFVNGAAIGPLRFDKSDPKFWNRLYRNLGGGRFKDVTEKARVRGKGFGLGVAVADFDNDGFPDLYVTNYAGNELYHNERDGTFREVTARAGVAGGGFSTSAAFFDYNRDGYLDLLITRYVDWSFTNNIYCGTPTQRDYCHPKQFRGTTNLLFRNNGDGTFTDVSRETAIDRVTGKGLGVAIGDFDRDGWTDVYVANDSVPEFLFRNQEGKTFEEIGLSSASALPERGTSFAGMGVDVADYDNDGWPDIFVTALSLEGYVLFRNNHDGTFLDVSERSGVHKETFYLSGWGTRMADFENKGWKDLFVANSHVMLDIGGAIRTLSYRQPMLLLQNQAGHFDNIAGELGPDFQRPRAARGAALGDLDNDGHIDIVVQVLGERPLILRNQATNRNHWLGLKLIGTKSSRDAIGAVIEATNDAGERQYYEVSRTGSYLSSSDPRVLIGFGEHRPALVDIRWPSGRVQRVEQPPCDRYMEILEPRL